MYVKAAHVVLNPSRYKTRCDAIFCNSNIIDRCMEEVKLYSIVLKLAKASEVIFSSLLLSVFYSNKTQKPKLWKPYMFIKKS